MDKPKGILLICASPRRQGTSHMLLKRIHNKIGGQLVYLPWKGSLGEMVLSMKQADTIIISGPCWINSYPARLVELLTAAATAGGFHGQKLYGIINGGMPYTHTHAHGLKMLSLFAKQNGLCWQGGFVMGGGAMLDGQPLDKHLSRKTVVPAFEQFICHINQGSLSPDSLFENAQHPPGRLTTHLFAYLLTFLTARKIRKHGHNPDAPSPYL